MALTSDELTIGNQALDMIGQQAIDSTDIGTSDSGTGGAPYAKLERIFDQTRNALLRSFEWNFAAKRIALVDDWATDTTYTTDQYAWVSSVLYKCNTAHTSTTWNTDYVMDGSDYVKDDTDYVRDDSVTFYWDLVTDRPETYWSYRYALPSDFSRFNIKWLKHNDTRIALESGYILTDAESLDISYLRKVTDPTEFDDLFTEILIFDLAIKLSYSIMGSAYQTQALRKDLRNDRTAIYLKARQVCIAEVNQTGDYKWTDTRLGSGIV